MKRTLHALRNVLFVSLFSFLFVGLPACASHTVLYDGKSATQEVEKVKIILIGEPTVKKDSFIIYFKFESPTDDTHVIQQIELNKNWIGIESFRMYNGKFAPSQRDKHFSNNITRQGRRMTVMPGKIEDADESLLGFAMLPSGWPNNFNEAYREKHEIKGRITKMVPEAAITYILNFNNGVLTFEVEGTDIKHTWTSEE